MINFRLLRSRGTRETFVFSFHRREKSSFSVKNCKLAAPLGFFQGLWASYREKYFRLTMFRDINLQFKLLSRHDSYIV